MEHTAVILMLCVTTSGDLIIARAKINFMEMGKIVQVKNMFRAIFD